MDLVRLSDDLVLIVLSELKLRDKIMFATCSAWCRCVAAASMFESAPVTWMDFADEMNVECDRDKLMKW